MPYTKTTYLLLCAIFAALTGVCSGIILPLPFTPIPVTLATMAVILTGGLLGSRYGSLSMVVYLLIGALGAPVFSGYTSGIGKMLGPTGGYLIGYLVTAYTTGFIIEQYYRKKSGKNLFVIALALTIGMVLCYTLGTLWFILSTHTTLWAALVSCVFPFLVGDILKIMAATLLISKLRPILF